MLVFPGLFKGVLRVRGRQITEYMKIQAAHALAEMVSPQELSCDCIIPKALNRDAAEAVARAVAQASLEEQAQA